MPTTPAYIERYTDVRDRTDWPRGPWDDEPEDKVVWVDDATNLDCMAVRGPTGGWCGYVGVPESHPDHMRDYEYVEVDVHGGLTYSDLCRPSDTHADGVCHIEQAGRPDRVWWLGFDCVHLGDIAPGMAHSYSTGEWSESYKPLGYVVAETARLAAQLAERAS